MNLAKITAVAIAALGMTALATADHSYSPCGSEVTTIGDGAASIYVINDDTGQWLYLESNGHAGLQRGGFAWYEAGLGSGVDAECWDVGADGQTILDPDMILL